MKNFPEVFDKFRTTWKYAIKKYDGCYKLVELYKGGEMDSAYATIFDGGESRSDIVSTLQLMVWDTLKDKEIEELYEKYKYRKEVKALRGEV